MSFLFVCYAAGALTVFSPYILPVVPFMLIRSGSPWRGTLPMLAGLAAAFAAAAALPATGAAWAAQADESARGAAIAVLAGLGLTLVSARAAELFARPFVRLGDRLNRRATPDGTGGAFVIGVATGLLWTPCAGPVLALVLTGGVLERQPISVALAAFAYAAGAATALALALSAGRKAAALLIRQAEGARERRFKVRFLDPGVQAFTFG
jgi:cytochrome c biogenesis protein CcdA